MDTSRSVEPPLTLLRMALGPAGGVPAKLRRLVRALSGYGNGGRLDERLDRLRAAGIIDVCPTKLQIAVGSFDMLRFFISPAAADYYRMQGLSYGFHQLLRFLDEPASLTDPVGLLSERDAIIGHLMQVVHANPVYDLQLLSMFDDGLEQLELQVVSMLAGEHPRAGSIAAIVEEPDYHQNLLAFVRAFRRDPRATLTRSNVRASAELRELDAIFGRLDTAMRYFASMPDRWPAALRHLAFARTPAGGGSLRPGEDRAR